MLEALPEEVVVLCFHFWEHAVVPVAPHEGGRLCPEETLGALPQPAAEDVAPEEGLDLGGSPRLLDRGVTLADQLHEDPARSGAGGDPLNGFIGSLEGGRCLALHLQFLVFLRVEEDYLRRVVSGIDIRLRQLLWGRID